MNPYDLFDDDDEPRNNPGAIKYHSRRGWIGTNTRALYAVTDKRTGHTRVVDGGGFERIGPEVTIRLATREEADEAGFPKGWKVADDVRDNPTGGSNAGMIIGALALGGIAVYLFTRSSAAPALVPPLPSPAVPMTAAQVDLLVAHAAEFKLLPRAQQLALIARLNLPANLTDDQKLVLIRSQADAIVQAAKSAIVGLTPTQAGNSLGINPDLVALFSVNASIATLLTVLI